MEKEKLRDLIHDLSQPLSAASVNINVVASMISKKSVNLPEIRKIISDVERENQHAFEILETIRTYIKEN
ncbi:MAG: hypothetical protein HQL25_05420 [Candidatus Omnitrophica bacterium]|nr:hypothetical protein [Candidatus Omnitrophota bacterium]